MVTKQNKKEKANKYNDDFSMNQCSLMVRVDGEELEVPLNFGMTSDEIKRLYPFILQFASVPIKNPAVEFGTDEGHGKYVDLSEEELEKILSQTNEQSRYWYGKSEASLLEIAVRFALDIKLRGIQELADLFMPVSPLELLEKKDIEPMSDEEAEAYIQDMGLETETDREHDPGDEHDIPLGVAGSLHVNLYDSTFDDDYLSDELDKMESTLDVKDSFEEMISKDINEESYASNYDPEKIDESQISGGLLNMYDEENESRSIFDEMDEKDGVSADDAVDMDSPVDAGDVGEFNETEEFHSALDVSVDDGSSDINEDDYDWDSEDEDYIDDNGIDGE